VSLSIAPLSATFRSGRPSLNHNATVPVGNAAGAAFENELSSSKGDLPTFDLFSTHPAVDKDGLRSPCMKVARAISSAPSSLLVDVAQPVLTGGRLINTSASSC
jgi:hypothetical protein